ncbi:MAG: hypothetical protein L6R37_001707 [Teloschistes peruensis]|nr:MAG: hypothetical protein L6R37_001707 [Teloschistes peruensis]
MTGATDGQYRAGSALEEIQTEAIGFQAIAGEAKLQLLPSPWPAEAPPPTTASLLSIAPRKGLLAAAGPDAVIIASTEAVRKAFGADGPIGNNNKTFTPQLTLKLGIRISHVAFSADESYLVLSAEDGGGLAVYEVQSLTQGNTQTAFEISTNNTSLRALLPNPMPEKAELFAVVTTSGQLSIANLNSRQFVPQGAPLKEGVSCVSWSALGKQLVAGHGSGACFQLTPEGAEKATFPPPPGLEGDQYVSALLWLETNVFLVAHTPSTTDDQMIPTTAFHVVTRQPQLQPSYTYQALPEPASPFGMKRLPPQHFLQRLRNFPPNLVDLIIVSCTASADVGLFSRADTPLTSDLEAEQITKVFTTTTMANDTRRAQLPVGHNADDTSPIGMVLDLSATEKVPRPLPNEEMDESPGPLPALMILNNEGLLTTWWIVYTESIRQGMSYPGLVAVGGTQPQLPAMKGATTFATSGPQNSDGLAKPAAPSFGSTGGNSMFGTSSALGSKPSPWGSGTATGSLSQGMGPSFGKPAFGSSTPLNASLGGAAFGASGGLGNRPSPWGAPSPANQTGGSMFGHTGSLGNGGGSTFGSQNANLTSSTQTSGGFASFAGGPGFAAAAAQQGGESPFSKTGQGASSGSGMDTDSIFGRTPKKSDATPAGLFGSSSFGDQFKLGSTFKGDGTSSSDRPKPAIPTGSLFGGGFANSLEKTQEQPSAPESKEADMIEDSGASEHDAMSEASNDDQETATPAAKPQQPLFGFQQTAPPISGGLFGTQAQSKITPALVQKSTPATLPAAKPPPDSTTPEDTPKKSEDVPRPSVERSSPKIKAEPKEHTLSSLDKRIPEGPLPPDATSKDSYSPGGTSHSSGSSSKLANDDASTPSDFSRLKADRGNPSARSGDQPALTGDDESGLDDEGSGVDVAEEISPTTDPTQTPKITPGSSFGPPADQSPESLFNSRSKPTPQQRQKTLFGEVNNSSSVFFPPPSKSQESPRSPSPIRSQLGLENLRPDNARSISAPNAAIRQLPGRKPASDLRTSLADRQSSIEEQQKRERERLSAQRAQQIAEERQDLHDQEDENIRDLLNTKMDPTTVLEEFIAHEDYSQDVTKNGLPGQIEKVYRDINSMIDTIGLNARNLEAFIRGHSELCKEEGRSLDDLDKASWCLGEVDRLSGVEDQISTQVDKSRISDVQSKLGDCRDLRQDLQKLETRQHDVLKILDARSDSNQKDSPQFISVSAEQGSQQKKLRDAFKRIQELTADVERKVLELRVDLTSQEKNSNDRLTKQPTVEAVLNTIAKMTGMAQQRSSDVDVLEAQIRKLHIPMATANGSRESSPFTTSTSAARSDEADGLSTTMGGLKLSVSNSRNGTPRKQASNITPNEASRYRTKMQQRKAMNAAIKKALKSQNPVVQPLD